MAEQGFPTRIELNILKLKKNTKDLLSSVDTVTTDAQGFNRASYIAAYPQWETKGIHWQRIKDLIFKGKQTLHVYLFLVYIL